MTLANVAAGLRAAFIVRECPAQVFVGEQYIYDHDAEDTNVQPPEGPGPALTRRGRVVLVPNTDGYGPVDVSLPGMTTIRPNPRPLMTRKVNCTAHLWAMCVDPDSEEEKADSVAADYDAMDALINCTLASLCGIALGVSEIGGGQYVNDQAVHMRRGISYQLTFSVACPIVDVKWPPGRQTTYDQGILGATVQVDESLGEPPTDQTGVEFQVPTPVFE